MIDGCGVGQCIDVSFGPVVDVINNHITIYDAHGTQFGIVGFGGFDPNAPESNPPTLTIEDNTIVGVGGTAASFRNDPSAYAIDGTGIHISNATATIFRNSVTNANRGFFAVNGGTITDGSDNVVDFVLTGVTSFNQSAVDIHSSDFTDYQISIEGDFDPGSLTCNWWGNTAGPQNVPGALLTSVFTPFATALIARTGASGC